MAPSLNDLFFAEAGSAFARQLALGDLIEEHADTDALWRLIESGAPQGLPFIPPGAPA